MKYILSFIIACLFAISSFAQDTLFDYLNDGSWRRAFSEEGRQQWTPEFTLRYSAGFTTDGPAATAGMRVDAKRTLGIWIGQGNTYYDYNLSHTDAIQTAAYMRRYVHVGKRDIVAFYGELAIGCDWVYNVGGGSPHDPAPRTPGDVEFYGVIHAGMRVRFVNNLHLFLGPTLATNCIGLHLGLGF